MSASPARSRCEAPASRSPVCGRARLRTVTVGLRSNLEAEIVEGLSEGALLVLHAGDRVSDGTRVALRES